jgi:hypothetical protein
VSEALASALGAARSRLEADLAVAEAELAAARERCRILRQSLAVARNEAMTRAASSVAVAASATTVARPAPSSRGVPDDPEPPPPSTPSAPSEAAPASEAASRPQVPSDDASPPLPRRWRLALGTLRRGDPSHVAAFLSPHAILRWEGDHPFAGTVTGEPQVAAFLTELAALVVPGSIRAEQLAVIERGVDVLVRLSLAAPTVAEPLDTRLACRFRFDDLGRIDFCVVMGEDPAEVDAFFRAAVAAAD